MTRPHIKIQPNAYVLLRPDRVIGLRPPGPAIYNPAPLPTLPPPAPAPSLRFLFLPSDQAEGGLLPVVYRLAANSSAGNSLLALDGANAYSSGDALNWTDLGATGTACVVLAFGGGIFVGAGYGGVIATSPTGAVWTPQTSNAGADLWAITYGGGSFVAGGNAGTTTASADGTNWSASSTVGASSIRGLAYGNSVYVAVSEHGAIDYSNDGVAWQAQAGSSNGLSLRGIDYSSDLGLFVTVGDSGACLTSSDGNHWIDLSGSFTPNDMMGVAWGAGLFAACDTEGNVWTSANGADWAIAAVDPTSIMRNERAVVYWQSNTFIVLENFSTS